MDDPVNRVDAWGLKPYFCKWTKCDEDGTIQGDYQPIEGKKDELPFLLDFSIPIGEKRYTILPSLEVDPFFDYYKNKEATKE